MIFYKRLTQYGKKKNGSGVNNFSGLDKIKLCFVLSSGGSVSKRNVSPQRKGLIESKECRYIKLE